MGRELRRVPPNWEHPTRDHYGRAELQPMYDRTHAAAAQEWLQDFDRVRNGDADDVEKEYYPHGICHWASENHAPDPAYYRPWADEDATWWQLWETVTEGTPVSPPFETQEELIDYLADNGDFWDQKRREDSGWGRERAERFVRGPGWAPSFVAAEGRVMSGVEYVGK